MPLDFLYHASFPLNNFCPSTPVFPFLHSFTPLATAPPPHSKGKREKEEDRGIVAPPSPPLFSLPLLHVCL